jgi:hypothetical protein
LRPQRNAPDVEIDINFWRAEKNMDGFLVVLLGPQRGFPDMMKGLVIL